MRLELLKGVVDIIPQLENETSPKRKPSDSPKKLRVRSSSKYKLQISIKN